MPPAFLAPPASFIGREDLLARFKARLEHYNFFIYEGLAGIGTTTLMRRLIKETRPVGVKASLFLRLVPGEGVSSILARIETRMRGKSAVRGERQGDPFSRLVETLANHRLVVALDGLHNLRRDDLSALVRALRAAKGPFRVLATSHGDPELSAMDAALLHKERVGPLAVEEVRRLVQTTKLAPQGVDRLVADAARGGCAAQPLTLRYLLALCLHELPPKALLDAQSARSVNAFRAVMAFAEARLTGAERDALIHLAAVGEPISRAVAVEALGGAVPKLVARGLVDEIDGDVHVHSLVAQYFGAHAALPSKEAAVIAAHLKDRALKRSEPLSLIRAGKLLAQAGRLEEAVATLADGWEAVRDLGFSEAYLKILASIPATGVLIPRLALLSARARMRHADAALVREELERLANERDGWTKARALAALTMIYSDLEDHARVVKTFEALRKVTQSPALTLSAGPLAATAMVKLGNVTEAEKLARGLLARLRADQDPVRHGELHRLLSQVNAQMGQLARAVEEATLASKFFTAAGDLYHAATAAGFIGDLYREMGDFAAAQMAFKRFHELAQKWGDRNLVQIAELTEAWVALDVGDVTSAQKRIAAVEKDLSATASRRLRRYLAAAKALLEVGRGHHEAAAELLPRVVEQWDASGPRTVADMLRAQLIRSYIAVGRIDEASRIVDESLARLDPKTAAPRVAMFLRESALIRLRRKDTKRAMAELAQACKLFAQGGNRRDEAHTLYRIAHAAFDEGDLELASSRAAESLKLAKQINHARVVALARELQGRVTLARGDVKAALLVAREALAALKRLGDEIGTLHVSELLLTAEIAAGDLAVALRLGVRLTEQAEALGVREVRIRAITLTGVALLRKQKVEAAARCFREVPEGAVSPWTATLMWRLGEALAAVAGDANEAAVRREKWTGTLRRLPETRQSWAVKALERLELPPHERCQLRTRTGSRVVGAEEVAWLDPATYDVFIDLLYQRAFIDGQRVELAGAEVQKLLAHLVVVAPGRLSVEEAGRALFGAVDAIGLEERVRSLARDLAKILRGAKELSIETKNGSVRLVPPRTYAFVVPMTLATAELTGEQKKILKLVQRLGSAPLTKLEKQLKVERVVVKREVEALVRSGLLAPVREGRVQVFRIV